MPQTRLKKKERKALKEQIASKDGLEEVKSICEEEGITLTDAYNYIAPKETTTSEAVEKTDTVDEILANDGLRVFSEDDKPANPMSDFKKTYQKDCFWEKCAKAYNDPFKKSNLLRKSYEGLHPPGDAGNERSRVMTMESDIEPEIPIAGLTSKIDYVSTSNVEIPTITNTVSTVAAQMVANPPGSDTRHVTIQVGELKVKLKRVGIGLLWEDSFEDSELSGPAIARFAMETAANDLDTLGRAGIKLLVDALSSATPAMTVPSSGWTYRLAREAETLRRVNNYLLNAIVGERGNILDLDAARATAYNLNTRPMQDMALSNVTSAIQTLNFTTDTTSTGVSNTALYAYNLSQTLGLIFRQREIVITRDYEIPQKDMMVRYFRRYGAMYLQPNAPYELIAVP